MSGPSELQKWGSRFPTLICKVVKAETWVYFSFKTMPVGEMRPVLSDITAPPSTAANELPHLLDGTVRILVVIFKSSFVETVFTSLVLI